MKLPQFLKSFIAWIAKTPTEVIVMADVNATGNVVGAVDLDALPADVAPVIPVVAVIAVAAGEAQPAPVAAGASGSGRALDAFDKLKTILKSLGHEIPVYFDEAVALAKKAL